MFIPVNLKYTKDHLWIRPIGREDIYVGLTDYAQKELGRIDFIEINHEGKILRKGAQFGIVYGANKTLELIMPVNGRVLIINIDTQMNPRLLNSDAYHHWIALITFSAKKINENDFLHPADYIDLINLSVRLNSNKHSIQQ